MAATPPSPGPDDQQDHGADRRRANRAVRWTVAPFAAAGPLLCAVVLLTVELTSRAHPSTAELSGQVLGALVVLTGNLYASRRVGLRLAATQHALTEQVTARHAAEAGLRQAVTDLQARETRLTAQQDELTRRNHDLTALGSATSAVLSGVNAREAVCQAAADTTHALAVVLFEPDPTGRQLHATHTAGPLSLPALILPVAATSLTARTYRTASTQLITDISTDPHTDQDILTRVRSLPGGEQLRAAVFVPVVHEGRSRAVLVALLDQPVTHQQSRVPALLELLAADAALALSREDLTAELSRQAVTDPLTGVANRRRWDTDLARESRRATRTGSPLSMVMLDLDHFKTYNDAHGHPAGDRLLQQTTLAWQQLLRADDVLARLGGEEFAVLLPDCDSSHATAIAQILLRAVPHQQTCSAGVAQHHGDTPQQLLDRADQALYAAKQHGRNQVHTSPDRPTLGSATTPPGTPQLLADPAPDSAERAAGQAASRQPQVAAAPARLHLLPPRTG